MPIKPADQQRLDTLYSEHKASYGGRREESFALLYLTRRFGVTVEEVAHQVAFGGNDYGVDAYYLDRRARNLYLYQFKWTEDYSQFKGPWSAWPERDCRATLETLFRTESRTSCSHT